jgi:Flp pilus assembly protein TadD
MLLAGVRTWAVRIGAAMLLIFVFVVNLSGPTSSAEQVCDVAADYALGIEDYPTAIKLHCKLLRSSKDNALAHYHLGFAYGMVGRTSDEISEYRAAATLGLDKWDLFLNLGLAYADRQELSNAVAALEHAVVLGSKRAETHSNLALVYERENRLSEALREITISRRLQPGDLDAENTNAILCAKVGDILCARNLWTHLIKVAPGYSPARANLAILANSGARGRSICTTSRSFAVK